MADPQKLVFLHHEVFFSEGVDMPDTVRLQQNARRMATSMQRLFAHISVYDARAAASARVRQVIFPSTDSALQNAISLVLARLAALIPVP